MSGPKRKNFRRRAFLSFALRSGRNAVFVALAVLPNLFFPLPSFSADVRTFTVAAPFPVAGELPLNAKERRESYRRRLFEAAVFTLVGKENVRKYSSVLRSRVWGKADDFLLSLVVREGENGQTASAEVDVEKLSGFLLEQSVPVLNLPVFPVDLVHDGLAEERVRKVTERLADFNVRVRGVSPFDRLPAKATSPRFSSRSYFASRPEISLVYLLKGEGSPAEPESYSLEGFKRDRPLRLFGLRVDRDEHSKASAEGKGFGDFEAYFLDLLNPARLQTSLYASGDAGFRLVVKAPFDFEQVHSFRALVLRKNPLLESSRLERMSRQEVVFRLEFVSPDSKPFEDALKSNRFFDFGDFLADSRRIVVSSPKMKSFGSNPAVRRPLESDEAELLGIADTAGFPLSIQAERENNNVVPLANRIVAGVILKGRIAGRVDRDLFFLPLEADDARLDVRLVQRAGSTFRLKMTFYDGELNPIRRFHGFSSLEQNFGVNLPASALRNPAAPPGIYIRMEDKAGYLPFEAGRKVPLDYYLTVRKRKR